MKKIVSTVLLIVFISCNSTNYIDKTNTLTQSDLFQIVKIETHKSYYEIYAKRNDSIFKIISDKNIINTNCNRIKLKQKYNLILKRTIPLDSILGIPIAPNLGINRFEMPDGSVIKLEKESHYSLYRSQNLDGLCISDSGIF